MSTLFSDNFNRANSTNLGTSWNEDNLDWSIVSNQLTTPVVGGATPAVVSTTSTAMTAVADMSVQVTQVTLTNADGGPIARRTAVGVMYTLDCYLGNLDLYRHSALGTNVLIASTTITRVANGVLRLETQGTALRAFYQGVQKHNTTDSNITAAGQGGVYSWDGHADAYDDFSVSDFAAGGGSRGLFRQANLDGLSAAGSFFGNPLA